MTERDHAGVPLLHDYLALTAARLPGKIALVAGEERISYADIESRANTLAHALIRRGVEPGDRVVIFGENSVRTAIAFWGVLKANAVVSIVAHQSRADRLARILDDLDAAVLVADGCLAATVSRAIEGRSRLRALVVYGDPGDQGRPTASFPPAVAWDDGLAAEPDLAPPHRRRLDMDLASIIYTSGSTGEPKGVMMTHRNMTATAVSVASYLGIREDDVILNVLPFSFSYGLYQMIMAFRAGARIVLGRALAYPGDVVRILADEAITVFPGVPAVFAVLADLKTTRHQDFPRVRCVTSAAAALPAKRVPQLKRLFPNAQIFSMYGLTECKRVSYLPPDDIDRKPGSVGIAIPNMELWIENEAGGRCPPGEVGELVVRGANVMLGYWRNPEATAKRLRPGLIPGESVLHTGDLCRLDDEGYLYFVSRTDDILKSGGEKVAPQEVEHALLRISGVREAAVIGVPDDVLGNAVHAYVVLDTGVVLTPLEIQRRCQGSIEAFKIPKIIEIVADMPRTSTGKVDKPALRATAGVAADPGRNRG